MISAETGDQLAQGQYGLWIHGQSSNVEAELPQNQEDKKKVAEHVAKW